MKVASIYILKNKKYGFSGHEPSLFIPGVILVSPKKHDGSGFQGVAEIRRDGTAGGF